MSRQDFYNKCRVDYPTFTYQGYHYDLDKDGISMTFDFSIDGLSGFHPTWYIPRIKNVDIIDEALIEDMVFSLGMVELVSYWKIACPPTVIIKDRQLSADQINWWKKLYWGGLGEMEEMIDDYDESGEEGDGETKLAWVQKVSPSDVDGDPEEEKKGEVISEARKDARQQKNNAEMSKIVAENIDELCEHGF